MQVLTSVERFFESPDQKKAEQQIKVEKQNHEKSAYLNTVFHNTISKHASLTLDALADAGFAIELTKKEIDLVDKYKASVIGTRIMSELAAHKIGDQLTPEIIDTLPENARAFAKDAWQRFGNDDFNDQNNMRFFEKNTSLHVDREEARMGM